MSLKSTRRSIMLFGSTSRLDVERMMLVPTTDEDNSVPLLFSFDAVHPLLPPLQLLGGVMVVLLLLRIGAEVEAVACEDGGAESLVHSPQFLITRETVSLMRTQW